MNENSGQWFPTDAYPDPNEELVLGLRFEEVSAVAFSLAKNSPRKPKGSNAPPTTC